ncbi:hypothetical protein LBMAG42_18640 [Deltaproteobacteria bacterium]|nr:hypothetical protein LBMAG42_18640 [Deltaproteobacteria bacterium]
MRRSASPGRCTVTTEGALGAAGVGVVAAGARSSVAHTPLRWFIVGTWASQQPIEQNTRGNLVELHVETLHLYHFCPGKMGFLHTEHGFQGSGIGEANLRCATG